MVLSWALRLARRISEVRKGEPMSKFAKPTGGCIKCAKSKFVRTGYFCGNKKLTEKQLFNKKGYCSDFVPIPERRTE